MLKKRTELLLRFTSKASGQIQRSCFMTWGVYDPGLTGMLTDWHHGWPRTYPGKLLRLNGYNSIGPNIRSSKQPGRV